MELSGNFANFLGAANRDFLTKPRSAEYTGIMASNVLFLRSAVHVTWAGVQLIQMVAKRTFAKVFCRSSGS